MNDHPKTAPPNGSNGTPNGTRLPGEPGHPVDIDHHWNHYLTHHDPHTQTLIETHYAPLAIRIAERTRLNLPPGIDNGDLVTHAYWGLQKAITNYDPSRGAKFETYAHTRMLGAIRDHIRNNQWMSRRDQDDRNAIQTALTNLYCDLQTTPTTTQIADHLNTHHPRPDGTHWTPTEVNDTLTKSAAVASIDLDDDQSTDRTQHDPAEHAADADLERRLHQAARTTLAPREQQIYALYRHEGLTQDEIGRIYDIKTPRVSQILSAINVRLATHLRDGTPGASNPRRK